MSIDVNFVQVLKDNGIPTTQAELETKWRELVASTGSLITNDDKMSPFWRLITACITTPMLWLVNFLAVTALPNAYVRYATGVFLDLLADAVNLTRKPATKAVGVVTFTRSSTAVSTTIPLGFIVQTATINGVIYQLITKESKSFPTGLLTVAVAVEAVGAGSAYNLAAGYYSITPTALPNITATNALDWLTVPGADIESDDALRQRVRNQFGTAAKFHTDSVYRSLIASFPGVKSDAIYFVHNAPRGPGTANAYVLFDFAAPVVDYLAAINHYITDDGYHGHGDDLIVYQMPEQNQTLAVTVWVDHFTPTVRKNEIKAEVEDIIKAAFRENTAYNVTLTLPYARFSFSKLGEEIHLLSPDVRSLEFSLDDIVSALCIPRLTSLTVTVSEIS